MRAAPPDPPTPAPPGNPPGSDAIHWLHLFVAAVEHTPGVAVYSLDDDGVVRFWNNKSAELFGVPVADAIGRKLADLASYGLKQEYAAMLDEVWRSGEPDVSREWQVSLQDGSIRWLQSSHFLVKCEGARQQLFCMTIDITERKAMEAVLARAALVFENSRDAIIVVDRNTDVVAVNQAFTDISGFAPEDVIGHRLPGLHVGAQADEYYEQIRSAVAQHGHWEGELTGVRKNGECFPAEIAVTEMGPDNYMVVLSDITARKRAEEEALHLAKHDALTGLPNRVLFRDRLQQALAAARRQGRQFALMFVDLDRFKQINDTLGHHAGDTVLKEVATRLMHTVRSVDTVSRLGGDEFVVLLADIGGADQAAHVAGSIMQAVARPVRLDALEIVPSLSIGIALGPADGQDAETLLRHADVAMYHAKQSGTNQFSFFSPRMNEHVIERVHLETMLRRALDNQEFVLEYQPEVDILSGRTIGVEALLRWRHPERGLLLPVDFIAAAEESGLLVQIGEWVLREACRQARAWRDGGFPVAVAVNLSKAQFSHKNLVHSVDEALAASRLEPQFLDLEITEGVIMCGDPATAATVEALRARGVQLTVDDFGTGFMSLSSLRRFPLSKLKIDRSFIEEITRAPSDAALIPAIIALARSLRMKVSAEGVETAEQLRYLAQHGCDEYQGFYASLDKAGLTGPRP